ncbi:MAG: hypothetical protein CO108_10075 [Deltaproteobacteria bacterium CG_4_9_14_3_um_filter_63_12]|nr:MAG: hypothetical protein CO108_10075 [Deltaproteobacteria bacterium CG_4_9_14_3_um_filter_63_12]
MKTLRTLLLTASILLLFTPWAAAQESLQPRDAEVEAVYGLLNGIDTAVSDAQFESVATDPVGTMLLIDSLPNVPSTMHKRIASRLAAWPDERVAAHYEAILADENADTLLKARAIVGMGRAFGSLKADRLEAYLFDADVQLQLAAVEALSLSGETGVTRLKAALVGVKSDAVKVKIEKALSR